jgi:hypothetical protein
MARTKERIKMNYVLKDINESYTELETDDLQFKKKVIDTLSVHVEGYQFSPAYRAGIWDGLKKFYTIEPNTNIRFPKGLVQYIIADLEENNYSYEYDCSDEETDITEDEFNDFLDTLDLPFAPYDYQIKAAYYLAESAEFREGRIQYF